MAYRQAPTRAEGVMSLKHYLVTLILIVVIGAVVDGVNILLGLPLWNLTPSEMILVSLSVLLIYTAAYFSARWLLAGSIRSRLRNLIEAYVEYVRKYGDYE